jgi:iron complex transport system permease protein
LKSTIFVSMCSESLSRRLFWPLLIVGMAVVTIWALCWGAPIPISDLFSSDTNKVEIARQIFLELRPPRVLAALLVGASLSVAGAVLQTMFRNPLAEPYLLGISAGGALGATLSIALALPALWFFDTGALLAFAGAIASSLAVYLLGKSDSNVVLNNHSKLLLVGVALSAFLAALMSLVVTLSGNVELAQRTSFWLLGGFTRSSWSQNLALAITFLVGFTALYSCSRDLNALRAGEEDARSLGVDVSVLHRKILLCSALLCATSVAAAGLIGFVGLLAPHTIRLLCRRLGVGSSIQVLLPASALCGAALLCGCDALAHGVFAPIEVPVGIFTALLGVPLFLSIARRF